MWIALFSYDLFSKRQLKQLNNFCLVALGGAPPRSP